MSTGEFHLQPLTTAQVLTALDRIQPKELVISEKTQQDPAMFEALGAYKSVLTIQPHARFDVTNGQKRLEELFGVKTLESFGGFHRAEISAAGTLVDYIHLTQKGKMPHLAPPRQMSSGDVMEIDSATRRNLELVETMQGQRKGSLLATVDRTVTGAGSRLLAKRLNAPLTNVAKLNDRYDLIDFFIQRDQICNDVRNALKQSPDMERAIARLSLGRGGPRDLANIRDTLGQSTEMFRLLHGQNDGLKNCPSLLNQILDSLKIWGQQHPLIDRLQRALKQDLPTLARDGGFIARGYSPQLDEFTELRDNSRRTIAALQKKYAEMSDINTLKVKHNNVLGLSLIHI